MEDLGHTEAANLLISRVTKPGDTSALNLLRNKSKIKHIMLGSMIWDSLTFDSQLEIIGDDEVFKKGEDYDDVAIWHYIRNYVIPSMTTGTSAFKDGIEPNKVANFGNNLKSCHTWIADARTVIIKDEGEELYNKYLRSMFYTHLTVDSLEFVETVKVEKRL